MRTIRSLPARNRGARHRGFGGAPVPCRGRTRAHRAGRTPAPAGNRRGMTILEVLVAVILLSVGLLALAGVAGGVGTMMRGGDAQTTTAMAVQTGLEQLAATGNCRSLVASGATRDSTVVIQGVTIHKRLQGLHNVIAVRDSVQLPGRARPLIYRSMIPCRN